MLLYVTEPFDVDGESFQTGDTLTAEQYEKLRLPVNYGHFGKVTVLSGMAEERVRMRDATPNKPVHANVHPREATTGHSGPAQSILRRTTDADGKEVDHSELRKKIADDFTAPIAPNEGDTRKSVLHSLMGEHANDPNYLKAHGAPNADEAKHGMGTEPLDDREADDDDFHEAPKHANLSEQAGNVAMVKSGDPVQKIAIVPEPKGDEGDGGAHDRANEPGKGLPASGSGANG